MVWTVLFWLTGLPTRNTNMGMIALAISQRVTAISLQVSPLGILVSGCVLKWLWARGSQWLMTHLAMELTADSEEWRRREHEWLHKSQSTRLYSGNTLPRQAPSGPLWAQFEQELCDTVILTLRGHTTDRVCPRTRPLPLRAGRQRLSKIPWILKGVNLQMVKIKLK